MIRSCYQLSIRMLIDKLLIKSFGYQSTRLGSSRPRKLRKKILKKKKETGKTLFFENTRCKRQSQTEWETVVIPAKPTKSVNAKGSVRESESGKKGLWTPP